MRVSYNWLRDYVDINISAQKLAQVLTMAGLTVDSIEKRLGDSVLDIEITSNRPDWLSYIGIAREVAAITGKKLKMPSAAGIRGEGARQGARGKVTVKVEDKKLCPRYTARIIRNVKVGASPGWLKKKIEAAGLRPVNNIVDITNFCLFETGEPMHAFDLDNLSGSAVIIRKAAKGEKIIAIDGAERLLDESMLVIADSALPAAIAGVMGGLKTEVGNQTKDILLEAAYFDPISIRRTSRLLALSTESSYRFERKVDIDNIQYASDRAARLILEIAGGEMGEFIDTGKIRHDKRAISLRYERLNKVTGVDIPPSKTRSILTSLGARVKSLSRSALKLEAPFFRHDLQSEIDLIEEVARVYGYGNIPETIPQIVEKGARLPFDMAVDNKIREILTSLGLSEIITYSLLSKPLLLKAKISDADVIEIKNPLSAEQEVMRPSSIAGMLNSIRHNINRKTKSLRLFELGNVYFKEGADVFKEKRNLSMGVTGLEFTGWTDKSRGVTLFDLKGVVETLFLSLGVVEFSTREVKDDTFSPAACSSIEVKGEPLGIIGEIDPEVLDNFDIKDRVYIAEIDCEKLLGFVSLEKQFKEPPKYPSVVRDISIVVDKNISNGQVISSIKETAGRILKDAQLIDRYRGVQIPDGKTGLTYRLEYQDLKRTLLDLDVQEVHFRVVRALENNLGARLR
ncbi:MAG: phenylalanine--tRNA ligase subunit beta [Omnitrophica bacterium RIFCSPLOWO2_02_FULL_45_16]|nr:MAG: phenylalanine--tRNA ligase subunit beta [Omnitrophica bacterium RIFCSPLOWO2_02_FULL_45_16]